MNEETSNDYSKLNEISIYFSFFFPIRHVTIFILVILLIRKKRQLYPYLRGGRERERETDKESPHMTPPTPPFRLSHLHDNYNPHFVNLEYKKQGRLCLLKHLGKNKSQNNLRKIIRSSRQICYASTTCTNLWSPCIRITHCGPRSTVVTDCQSLRLNKISPCLVEIFLE